MTITGASGHVDLWMPVWTPGAYELRTWGRNVTPLPPLVRTGPSTFRADVPPSGVVKLRYRVYAAKITDDGSHVDAGHALIAGSSLFLAVKGQERGLHEVRVTLPTGWHAVTALDEDASGWSTTSYEQLIDAPIECGKFAEARTRAAERAYVIAVDGATTVPARFVEDVAHIADAEARIAGAPPYRRYVVIVHLADEPGRVAALEHAASTNIVVPRRSLVDPDAYDELTYVVAHELFHAWNARRLRPAELVPYDLLHVQRSRALWITEGLTEYFAHRAMLRAGRWSRAQYFAHVSDEAERAVAAARHGFSIEDGADMTWQPPDEAADDWDAYYARGHLVAFAADALMRARSDGRHSLDEVVRAELAVAERQGGVAPIDSDRLARAIDERVPGVGAKLLGWVRDGNETPSIVAALATIGFQLAIQEAPPRAAAGFAAERDGNELRVVAVGEGGAADLAGLKPGDRIVAVDGAPPALRWADAIAHKAAGAPLVLSVARGNRTLELHLTLLAERDVTCRLSQAPATPAITKLRESLLSR